MVIMASTWADILIAAPIGFMIGLIVGAWVGGKYLIVLSRDRYKIERRNGYKENE